MHLLPLTFVLLGAQLTLAVPGATLSGVDAMAGEFYEVQLSQQLSEQGVKVLTRVELQGLVGLERQRAMLGCEDTACLAELASALGADGLVVLAVGKFSGKLQVTMKIVATRDGATVASFSRRVESEEAALDALGEGARAMVSDAARALGREAVAKAVAPAPPEPRTRWWIPVFAGGGLAVGVGVFFTVQAQQAHATLIDGRTALTEMQGVDLAQRGSSYQTAGGFALALGALAIAVSAVLLLLSRGEPQ